MTTPKADAYQQLRYRIVAAQTRLQTGQGRPRIPGSDTDPDVVLADCLAELDAARAREVAELVAREADADAARLLAHAVMSLWRYAAWASGYATTLSADGAVLKSDRDALIDENVALRTRVAGLKTALESLPCQAFAYEDCRADFPVRLETVKRQGLCRRCAALAEGEDTK